MTPEFWLLAPANCLLILTSVAKPPASRGDPEGIRGRTGRVRAHVAWYSFCEVSRIGPVRRDWLQDSLTVRHPVDGTQFFLDGARSGH